MQTDLDIVKIIRNLRFFEVFISTQTAPQKVYQLQKENKKQIIDKREQLSLSPDPDYYDENNRIGDAQIEIDDTQRQHDREPSPDDDLKF